MAESVRGGSVKRERELGGGGGVSTCTHQIEEYMILPSLSVAVCAESAASGSSKISGCSSSVVAGSSSVGVASSGDGASYSTII